MPGTLLFEYATIRVVPRVEREEFFNVGVILYCASKGFLGSRFLIKEKYFQLFCPDSDPSEYINHLKAVESICKSDAGSGPIGRLPVAERFRWLTATRSTIVQTSRVHPGLCEDPQEMLEHLFAQLVL